MANEVFKNCFLDLTCCFGGRTFICLTFSINCSRYFWCSNYSNCGQWAYLQAGFHVLLKWPRFSWILPYFLSKDVPCTLIVHSQLLTWPPPFLQRALVPFSREWYLEIKIWVPKIVIVSRHWVPINYFHVKVNKIGFISLFSYFHILFDTGVFVPNDINKQLFWYLPQPFR